MSRLGIETDTPSERLSPQVEALKDYYEQRTANPPEDLISMMKEILSVLMDLYDGSRGKLDLEVCQWWGKAIQELQEGIDERARGTTSESQDD